jgi:hypothetical protein
MDESMDAAQLNESKMKGPEDSQLLLLLDNSTRTCFFDGGHGHRMSLQGEAQHTSPVHNTVLRFVKRGASETQEDDKLYVRGKHRQP